METVGRFQILHRIASGGMAEVFLGRTTGEGGFEKQVAIKRILSHLTENEDFVQMFMDEARISASLNHSNIGQIFEFGRAADSYFIAMEYIHGLSLRHFYKFFRESGESPPPALAAYVVMNVCAALEYAHTKCDTWGTPLKIIHRDISPSNVLVSFNGEIKLIDFGIAKAAERNYETVGGDLKGKYAYMSPEQAHGTSVDHRSDIFSTGILLFELMTGVNPFRADNDLATLTRVREAKVPLPTSTLEDDSIGLLDIGTTALARDPAERYQSAGEMQEALEDFCSKRAFGSRQMARWMKKSFSKEEARQRKILQAIRDRMPPVQEVVEVAMSPTLVAQATDVDGIIEISTASTPSAAVEVVPLGTPSSSSPGTGPGFVVSQNDGPSRDDPSLGRVAVAVEPDTSMAAEMPVSIYGQPPGRRRRSSPLNKVVLIIITLGVLGGGGYLWWAKKTGKLGGDGRPIGKVEITVTPARVADVMVDGSYSGSMKPGQPFVIEKLLEGKHRIKLKGEEFKPVETIVDVVRGKTTSLQLTLE